jgi:hypothetical protein
MAFFWVLDPEPPGAIYRKRLALHRLLPTLRSLAARRRLGRIIDALAAAHDAAVQMIDTSIVRVHQHGACITMNQRQSMGRSLGGLTSRFMRSWIAMASRSGWQ